MIYRSAGVIAVDTGLGHLAAALPLTPCMDRQTPDCPVHSSSADSYEVESKLPPCVKKVCSYSGPGYQMHFRANNGQELPESLSSARNGLDTVRKTAADECVVMRLCFLIYHYFPLVDNSGIFSVSPKLAGPGAMK